MTIGPIAQAKAAVDALNDQARVVAERAPIAQARAGVDCALIVQEKAAGCAPTVQVKVAVDSAPIDRARVAAVFDRNVRIDPTIGRIAQTDLAAGPTIGLTAFPIAIAGTTGETTIASMCGITGITTGTTIGITVTTGGTTTGGRIAVGVTRITLVSTTGAGLRGRP